MHARDAFLFGGTSFIYLIFPCELMMYFIFFVKENDRWLDYEYMSILSTSFGFMAVIGYLMYNIPTRCRAYLAVLKGAGGWLGTKK